MLPVYAFRRAVNVRSPPSGMASRAFTARFSNAVSSRFGSAWAGGRSSAISRAHRSSALKANRSDRSCRPPDDRYRLRWAVTVGAAQKPAGVTPAFSPARPTAARGRSNGSRSLPTPRRTSPRISAPISPPLVRNGVLSIPFGASSMFVLRSTRLIGNNVYMPVEATFRLVTNEGDRQNAGCGEPLRKMKLATHASYRCTRKQRRFFVMPARS